MSDEIQNAVHDVQRRVGGFADEMRSLGIHVGINGRCVCGVPWPCSGSDTVTTPITVSVHLEQLPME